MSAFLEMSSAEFRRKFIDKSYEAEKPKKNKYGACKTKVGSTTYDSRKEASRGQALELLQKSGKIWGLEKQKRFNLIDPFLYHGMKVRGTYWLADFYYFDNEERCWVAEDVKSSATRKKPEYRIKMKLFMLKYPEIRFKEII